MDPAQNMYTEFHVLHKTSCSGIHQMYKILRTSITKCRHKASVLHVTFSVNILWSVVFFFLLSFSALPGRQIKHSRKTQC